MKKIFLSGATGYIGNRLAIRLAEEGNIVHALYRTEEKARHLHHSNILLFKGDILDYPLIKSALKGCDEAYHVAAFAKMWSKDPSVFYQLNIEGALNVIRAATEEGVKKLVVTSTAGVLGSSENEIIDENANPDNYFFHYEHSKSILETSIKTLCLLGCQVVIVNPSRVYGPGLLSESNGVTRMISKYLEGKWRFIPGNGKSIGNYVYIDDVVEGHILAMQKGRPGESYILGGENVDYNGFFSLLGKISGKKASLYHLPVGVMMTVAYCMVFFARILNISPLIIPELVRKFTQNFRLSNRKAEEELGYRPVSLAAGMTETIKWLNKE